MDQTEISEGAQLEEHLAGRLKADMDPDLLAFLRTKVDSFVKWDLIHFFFENPHTNDTARNIARYIGRKSGTTRVELIELAEGGVLSERKVGKVTVYSLTSDPKGRELITRLMEASEDRQFLVKAIYQIVRSMR
jgi:hypothetical protein